LIEHIWLPIRI